jgi:hypothetical protein
VRSVAPDIEVPCPGCYIVQESGDELLLTHARTGREHAFRVSVLREGGAHLVIRVGSLGGLELARLDLKDLPELARRTVVARLREELVERCLTADEAALLGTGGDDLPHVALRALERAVLALERDRSAPAITAVLDLADLLDLQGLHIPFDVQTAFYRIRAAAGPEAAVLVPVAHRLGFVED